MERADGSMQITSRTFPSLSSIRRGWVRVAVLLSDPSTEPKAPSSHEDLCIDRRRPRRRDPVRVRLRVRGGPRQLLAQEHVDQDGPDQAGEREEREEGEEGEEGEA